VFLLERYNILPRFLALDHLKWFERRFHHRSHSSFIRRDRFQKLISANTFTVFVIGAGRTSLPIRGFLFILCETTPDFFSGSCVEVHYSGRGPRYNLAPGVFAFELSGIPHAGDPWSYLTSHIGLHFHGPAGLIVAFPPSIAL
jgi:hypothetical protein